MATSANLIEQLTYRQFLSDIGVLQSEELDRGFAASLPTVWIYLKSIGLGEIYYDLLESASKRPDAYKELFYLMIFTNGQNTFFPHVPNDFLNIKIPTDVAAAQVEIDKPGFELTFDFTKEQLAEALKAVAKDGVMIRLGNANKAMGIMFKDGLYYVKHAANPRDIQYKTIESCVDSVFRFMNNNDEAKQSVAIKVEARTLKGMPKPTFPNSPKLFKKFTAQKLGLNHGPKTKPT